MKKKVILLNIVLLLSLIGCAGIQTQPQPVVVLSANAIGYELGKRYPAKVDELTKWADSAIATAELDAKEAFIKLSVSVVEVIKEPFYQSMIAELLVMFDFDLEYQITPERKVLIRKTLEAFKRGLKAGKAVKGG